MSMRACLNSCIFVLVVFFSLGCGHKDPLIIEGEVADEHLNGEKIYLVPFKNPTQAKVDSVIIENKKFRFKKREQDTSVYILRARPLLRLRLEEILVVSEPGTLHVILDKSSRAMGTPLNDSLQAWKEEKIRRDRQLNELRSSKATEKKIDSLKSDNIRFHYKFVKNNFDNAAGQLVYEIMNEAFSAQQKNKLESN